MIRSLLKLAVFVVVGLLVYNLFLGSPDEKENARAIFREFKDVGVAVKDLLKSEREKFDSGKYDKALDKIEGLLADLKERAKDVDENYLDRIRELERKRDDLERQIDQIPESYDNSEFTPKGESKGISRKEKRNLDKQLEDLLKDTETVIKRMNIEQEAKQE